jgi:hypothetical protein
MGDASLMGEKIRRHIRSNVFSTARLDPGADRHEPVGLIQATRTN